MKKIEKRMLSFLLALVMAISLAVPAPAEGECAHEYAVTERTEPGCDEPGCEVYTCALCGDSYTETLEPVHTPGEAVTENAVAPSCTEPGSHDTVIYCAVCGAGDANGYDGGTITISGADTVVVAISQEGAASAARCTGQTKGPAATAASRSIGRTDM